VASLIGLQCWTEISLEKFKEDGLISRNTLYTDNASRIIELLLRSHATIMLLAISVINAFALLILCLKVSFLHAIAVRIITFALICFFIGGMWSAYRF